MRNLLLATLLALTASACSDSTATHINALTGETCKPDKSYMPRGNGHANGGNDKCQGTGPGDNCDDLSSGKIDCIGDGNSGQGDDKKHNCQFPQPGCDENGCCDDDLVDPPPPPPEGDGGDGDGGGGDPVPPPDGGSPDPIL